MEARLQLVGHRLLAARDWEHVAGTVQRSTRIGVIDCLNNLAPDQIGVALVARILSLERVRVLAIDIVAAGMTDGCSGAVSDGIVAVGIARLVRVCSGAFEH